MTSTDNTHEIPVSLETVTNLARSNREWNKVYQYLLLHLNDFFVILPGRRWAIAHQVVHHGNVDLLKRILGLFSADQINIRSKTNDDKNFLDIAAEKRTASPAMYTYIEHLFVQDELIQEAKNSNWRSVIDILNTNRQLENEKPPYSPYFLLHYVVENGDAQILQELLDKFQVVANVLNDKNETPLDMATRLKKYDMCSILRLKTSTQSHPPQNQPRSPFEQNSDRSSYHSPVNSFNEPTRPYPLPPSSSFSPKSGVPTTQSPGIGFENSVADVQGGNHNTIRSPGLFNSARSGPPPPPPPSRQSQQVQTEFQHHYTTKSIISEHSSTNSNPPRPPIVSTSSDQPSMTHLICPITDEIFVDPVIAGDGYTYERAAILDWVNVYHKSPKTGATINAIFRDNIEIKQIIQSMRR